LANPTRRAPNGDATPPPSPSHGRRALSIERIKGLARRTFNRQVLSEIGGFNGAFALDAERFPDPVLVSATNGVGTKLQLAAQLGLHASIGADLVNHCVNDVAIQGATPLFFMDYFATGHLDPDIVQQVISGLVDACKAAGCALIGGETAEVPALYRAPHRATDSSPTNFERPAPYDLAGFLTGVVSRPRLLTGDRIREGDCLLGLPSNGLHTNGYGLAARLLFDQAGYRVDEYITALGEKAGAALMRPHRSYLNPIRKLLAAEVASGFAHITGGGLSGDIDRLLPRGFAAQLDLSAWEPPAIFTHLQQLGSISRDDAFATFNMGIGIVAVVPADLVKKARATLTRMNERSVVIGRILKKPGHRILFSD
jgi:phosphoribosylformylglycinamidine cyclo-ligase